MRWGLTPPCWKRKIQSAQSGDAITIVIRPGESRQVLDSVKYNPSDSFDCKVVDLVAVSDKELEFFSAGGTLETLHWSEAYAKEVGVEPGTLLSLLITLTKVQQDSEQASRHR